jgi:hypothetical protein
MLHSCNAIRSTTHVGENFDNSKQLSVYEISGFSIVALVAVLNAGSRRLGCNQEPVKLCTFYTDKQYIVDFTLHQVTYFTSIMASVIGGLLINVHHNGAFYADGLSFMGLLPHSTFAVMPLYTALIVLGPPLYVTLTL